MGKYEEVLEEGRGPRVPRSKGSKVPGSQGPRYLKLTFKYELDSKEGPSCCYLKCKDFMMNLCPIFGLVAAFFTIATNSFHINLHLYEYINSA